MGLSGKNLGQAGSCSWGCRTWDACTESSSGVPHTSGATRGCGHQGCPSAQTCEAIHACQAEGPAAHRGLPGDTDSPAPPGPGRQVFRGQIWAGETRHRGPAFLRVVFPSRCKARQARASGMSGLCVLQSGGWGAPTVVPRGTGRRLRGGLASEAGGGLGQTR